MITLGNQGSTTFDGAPLVAAGSDSGPVVAAQPNLGLSTVVAYPVDAGALKPGRPGTVAASDVLDLAVTPDGGTFLTAAGSDDHVAGFATADLSGRGSYPTGRFPNAVSVSADGGFVATGAFTSAHDVLVFASGGSSPVRTIGLGSRVTRGPRPGMVVRRRRAVRRHPTGGRRQPGPDRDRPSGQALHDPVPTVTDVPQRASQ
ncbi:MAG TPA: hypothetical protein VGG05_03140 [Pseudonocardiaceae bacterium]